MRPYRDAKLDMAGNQPQGNELPNIDLIVPFEQCRNLNSWKLPKRLLRSLEYYKLAWQLSYDPISSFLHLGEVLLSARLVLQPETLWYVVAIMNSNQLFVE